MDRTHRHAGSGAIKQWAIRLMAFALLGLGGVCGAQAPDATTQELLREAQRLAREAVVAYDSHYPDRPLWSEAIDAAERAHAAAPESLAVSRLRGEIYTRTRWWSRSWQAWELYLRLGGEVDASVRTMIAETAKALGDAAYTADRREQAIAYYEEVIRVGMASPQVIERIGRSYLALGRPEQAVPWLEQLAEGTPDRDAVLDRARDQVQYGIAPANALHDGIRAYTQGSALSALDHFRSAISARPDYARAVRWAAQTAEELGRLRDAQRYWTQLQGLAPGDAEARAALARLAERIAWGDAALRAYREGVSALERGALNAAIGAFERAVSANPSRPEPYDALGRIALAEGRPVDAEQFFLLAASVAPNPATYADQIAAARDLAAEQARAERADTAPPAPPPASDTAVVQVPEPEPEPDPAQTPAPEPVADVAVPEPEPEPTPSPSPTPASSPAQQPVGSVALPFSLFTGSHVHDGEFGDGERAFWFFRPGGATAIHLDPQTAVLHHRVTVRSKPSANPVTYRLCLVQDEEIGGFPQQMACTDAATLAFRLPGTYENAQPLAGLQTIGGFSWEGPVHWVVVMLQDGNRNPVDDRFGFVNRWFGSPIFDLYYPMDVRYEATIRP